MEHKVEELLEIIKLHNDNYRKGHPLVSDSVYDHEIEILRKLDPDNDWFKVPEPVKVGDNRKVSLPIPMKSLYKVKDISDLIDWCHSSQLTGQDMVVVMPKYDGLSLLCEEATGMAYSRGGAENEGQDCTPHLKKNGSPLNPRFKYTFGEFVFSVESWNANFAGKISPDTGNVYRSPRNTAAGLLNRDIPIDELKTVSLYRYGIDMDSMDTGNYRNYHEILYALCVAYNQPALYRIMRVCDLNEETLTDMYKKWRLQYYIDGLVVYADNLILWNKLGRQDTTGNPRYAIAYKAPDFTDTYETTVLGIEWGGSKSGLLKPVVKIDPVDAGDCEINSPTGYNASWIRYMKIAKGAKILITRSGGVIPKILQTLNPAPIENQNQLWKDMEVCPFCGTPTTWSETGIELVCPNPLCHATRQAKIIFFFETCGCENMGPETVAKLYGGGLTSVHSILHATYNDLIKIDGVGECNANIITKNSLKIRTEMDLPTLMQASCCFSGIGKVKAQKILDTLPEAVVECMYTCQPVNEITNMPSNEQLKSAPKTWQIFWNGISAFQNYIRLGGITIRRPERAAVNLDGKYRNVVACFSGIRNAELEQAITADGGAVVNTVNHKTTHLIVKDVSGYSTKIAKAKREKVPILTIEQFKLLFNN